MKKLKKIIIFASLILIIIALSNATYATLIDGFKKEIDTDASDDLKTEGGKIVGIIQVAGTMITVGVLGIIGIKYALGSIEEKAEYKKTMIPYLVGAILIFGFSNITQLIYRIADNKPSKPNEYCIHCGKKEIHTEDSDTSCLDCIVAAIERRVSTRDNSTLLCSVWKEV